MREGLDTWQALVAEMLRPQFLDMLAEAYGEAGQAKEGLSLPAEALAAIDRTGDCHYEAELYRSREDS